MPRLLLHPAQHPLPLRVPLVVRQRQAPHPRLLLAPRLRVAAPVPRLPFLTQ